MKFSDLIFMLFLLHSVASDLESRRQRRNASNLPLITADINETTVVPENTTKPDLLESTNFTKTTSFTYLVDSTEPGDSTEPAGPTKLADPTKPTESCHFFIQCQSQHQNSTTERCCENGRCCVRRTAVSSASDLLHCDRCPYKERGRYCCPTGESCCVEQWLMSLLQMIWYITSGSLLVICTAGVFCAYQYNSWKSKKERINRRPSVILRKRQLRRSRRVTSTVRIYVEDD